MAIAGETRILTEGDTFVVPAGGRRDHGEESHEDVGAAQGAGGLDRFDVLGGADDIHGPAAHEFH